MGGGGGCLPGESGLYVSSVNDRYPTVLERASGPTLYKTNCGITRTNAEESITTAAVGSILAGGDTQVPYIRKPHCFQQVMSLAMCKGAYYVYLSTLPLFYITQPWAGKQPILIEPTIFYAMHNIILQR